MIFFSLLFYINDSKKENNFLKQNIKLDSFSFLSQLDRKLELLENSLQQIKKEEAIPPQSPFFKLAIIENETEKVYLENSLNLEDRNSTSLIELIKSPHLNQTGQLEFQFKKIKENKKSYFILIKSISKNKKEIAFFKKDSSFFKLPSKKQNRQFVTANDKNDIVFYSK
ncbi:MAG: hypothetical protein OXN83_01950, partial [Oligoflexia bacterium]|nr:hypothetical protein [Oligoflexia bacterium]